MTDPNVTGDGQTVTIRIRISIRKRGGRKLVLAPDGTPDAGPVLVVVRTHFFESDRHGEPKICPEFRSGQPRGIRPGSPAPISISSPRKDQKHSWSPLPKSECRDLCRSLRQSLTITTIG
jgi:hypothetical protein